MIDGERGGGKVNQGRGRKEGEERERQMMSAGRPRLQNGGKRGREEEGEELVGPRRRGEKEIYGKRKLGREKLRGWVADGALEPVG